MTRRRNSFSSCFLFAADGNKIVFGRREGQEKTLCGLWGYVILIPYARGATDFLRATNALIRTRSNKKRGQGLYCSVLLLSVIP